MSDFEEKVYTYHSGRVAIRITDKKAQIRFYLAKISNFPENLGYLVLLSGFILINAFYILPMVSSFLNTTLKVPAIVTLIPLVVVLLIVLLLLTAGYREFLKMLVTHKQPTLVFEFQKDGSSIAFMRKDSYIYVNADEVQRLKKKVTKKTFRKWYLKSYTVPVTILTFYVHRRGNYTIGDPILELAVKKEFCLPPEIGDEIFKRLSRFLGLKTKKNDLKTANKRDSSPRSENKVTGTTTNDAKKIQIKLTAKVDD